jgi:aarF domain-containing kinase
VTLAVTVANTQVFREDLHINPEELFKTFSHDPLASASIAQVHKATLRAGLGGGGQEEKVVAVKVQKPAIRKQMEWDLFSYR